jgi:hypothetical protein
MTEYTDLQGLAVGQVWEHKNGNVYEIVLFTNLEAGRQDEYPTTVSYRNIHTGAPYSRILKRWAGSFKRRLDLEQETTDFAVFVHALVVGEPITRTYTLHGTRAECIDRAKTKLEDELGPVDRWVFINTTSKVVAQLKAVDGSGGR